VATLPPDTRAVGTPDPPGDNNSIVDCLVTITGAAAGGGMVTAQQTLNTLAAAVTNNRVLAGNGTNVTLRALAAADLPAATTGAQGAVVLPAASAGFAPSNPTGTSNSSTGVMMGLGSTIAYTPTGSGKVLINLAGVAAMSAGAAGSFTVGARFGTGTAPTNGAAATGTAFGPASDMQVRCANVSAAAGTPFAIPARLSLTPATAYWFDILVIQAVGTNTGGPVSVTCTIAEQLS
jgi:hypothetical protein